MVVRCEWKIPSRNILIRSHEMFASAPINNIDVETVGQKMTSTLDVKTSKTHPDVMHESRLTMNKDWCKTTFLAPVSHVEIAVWYTRKSFLHTRQEFPGI